MINCLRLLFIFIGNIYSQGTSGIDSLSIISESWCKDLPRAIYTNLERVTMSSDWFLVYKLENDVFAIYEPRQWQEVISYLILGKEKALLFDTGNGIGKISGVVNELTSLPVIVLIHIHILTILVVIQNSVIFLQWIRIIPKITLVDIPMN